MTTTTAQGATAQLADGTAAAGSLELRGLSKHFGEGENLVRAVDNIDLTIHSGEFVTLLGPSGCGKTTTLRMIAGFEDPTTGDIRLDGSSIARTPPNERPMSMVFQSYALFPHMTVFENVAYGLRLQKLPRRRIEEDVELVLTSMNLRRYANRAPNQLSGGQQQRVALARALVMKPKLLLFDEPLSNLDAKLRVMMRTEIRRLQERMGITSIYVTHDQDEAMSLSDRIVVMESGKIAQVGTPIEIYRTPASLFVADFLGQANFLEVSNVALNSDTEATVELLGQHLVVPRDPKVVAGDDALLMVRPESVRIQPQSSPGATGYPGRVISAVFYGQTVEYDVETAVGNIVAKVSDPDPAAILPAGSAVILHIELDRTWLIPHEAGR